MATWADVVGYVHSNYRVSDERPNMIKLVFEVGGLRTQVVFVWHLALMDGTEEWIQIESPFGELGQVDVAAALQKVSETVCGGLALYNNTVTFRHAVPLANMNINEFERPLTLVTSTADQFERSLTGGDQF
ncbi:MAG TPA: hypothetical protein VKB69_09090 [Micromonosporaceae bacterium]|nr:hypothetical protein [Micromonosporaceae bacterium]